MGAVDQYLTLALRLVQAGPLPYWALGVFMIAAPVLVVLLVMDMILRP